ncbi:PfkB family carbohydrate kinase [Spirillospora sp. CA-294931]|uniref:PfkB family carbohydrate kinase n=1 Tax=Spirillospora sp. CA-294931 TaxID=3240042 RepID=UPI003D8E25D9
MTTAPLVVLGDTLLDVDIAGSFGRPSPHAPVPVVEHPAEHSRPGGAGLAALLAAAGGGDVVLVTALADDEPGRRLRAMLEAHLRVVAFPLRGETPCKLRIGAEGQILARLNVGEGLAGQGPVPREVVDAITGAGAILVSDQGRGVTRHSAVRDLLGQVPIEVPIVWDPDPDGETPVPGTRLLTPNEDELAALAEEGAEPGEPRLAAAGRRGRQLARELEVGGVVVTLGESGALLCREWGTPLLSPAAPASAPLDSCGAGDSFAAGVLHVLAEGGYLVDAVNQGVRQAADFVGAGAAPAVAARLTGAAPSHEPDPALDAWDAVERTRRSRGTVVAVGGLFDLLHAGHVNLLHEARRLGDCLVVCVDSDASVRRRLGPHGRVAPAADRVRVLRALHDVDAALVIDEDHPEPVLRRLRPDVWVKGEEYAAVPPPEAETVHSYGGEVVRLPFLEERTTAPLPSIPKGTAS